VPAELSTFGVGSTEPRERVDRLAESLEIIRGLWSGEKVDYDGTYFTLRDALQRPAPTRRIPITIGGVGKRTLALAREHADWWNVPIHALHRLDELRDQVGQARVSMQPMIGLVPSERERQEMTALVQRRFGATKLAENIVVGTAGELTEHFTRLHASGVDRFYVWFTDFAQVETLHWFTEVIEGVGHVRARS
jgi:alkanesulfonate monooxygenase SsuD/methylene tetrahydromethanopterin reductase-like flavin-dependent oxidoreductase (luciferase family)